MTHSWLADNNHDGLLCDAKMPRHPNKRAATSDKAGTLDASRPMPLPLSTQLSNYVVMRWPSIQSGEALCNPAWSAIPFAFMLGVMCTLLLVKLCGKRRQQTNSYARPTTRYASIESIIRHWRTHVRTAGSTSQSASVAREDGKEVDRGIPIDRSHSAQVRVAAITWNVGAQELTFDAALKLLSATELPSTTSSAQQPADIFTIGFQEAVPLNAKSISAHSLGVGRLAAQRAERALAILQAALRALYREDYVAVDEPVVLVGLCLVVLMRPGLYTDSRSLYPRRVVRETAACGYKGMGNKGAVTMRMQLRETTVCFITLHLPAGSSAEAAAAREVSLHECVTALGLKMQRAGVMAPLAHDLCIVMGDFNSRVNVPRAVAENAIEVRKLRIFSHQACVRSFE